jgi:hypothetical protein
LTPDGNPTKFSSLVKGNLGFPIHDGKTAALILLSLCTIWFYNGFPRYQAVAPDLRLGIL